MFRRIWSLAIKEFIHLRNDWWLPAFMLIGGASELLLVGWATSRPITNLPMMVLDHDRSAASRALVISIENTGTFQQAQYVDDMATIEDNLQRGKINAAVIIPPDYSDQLNSPTGTPNCDGHFEWRREHTCDSILACPPRRGAGSRSTPHDPTPEAEIRTEFAGFDPSLRVWFNESLSEALYTTPAELGLMLEFTVLLFAALAFSRERELGTLEQLLVMPFSSLEIIIGKSIPVITVGFADFLLMLTMVHFAFGVPIRGSLAILLIVALGYLLVELGKGLVISVISRTQHQAFLLVLLIGMVDFMFTGYAAPVEGMPQALQWFANFIPAHHWLTILRGILLKGAGLDVLYPHVLILAGLVL